MSRLTGVKAGGDVGSVQAAIQMMLSAKGITASVTPEEAKEPLQQVLGRYTNADVAVLTGATLDEILYFVWKGQPVLAFKETGDAVVITGYTSADVTYYDPARGRSLTTTREKAETMFEDGGGIYISFLY